jgi:hypothetical protein
MKRAISIFACLVACFAAQAQVSANDLARTWKIKKGWFGDEHIVLELADTAKDAGPVQLYTFTSQGAVITRFYSKKNLGFCGNGMLYFDTASWALDLYNVTFDIRGGRLAESKFHYKMTYSVSLLSKGMLVLQLARTELKEEKTFH